MNKKDKEEIMNNIENDWKKLRELYSSVCPEVQKKLEAAFGSSIYVKTLDEIKTFDDACRFCGTSEKEFNERFDKLGLDPDTVLYEKLKIVCRAINDFGESDVWKPDFSDKNQNKYMPWFEFVPGVGFRCVDCGFWSSGTHVGSRLCYRSADKAKYAGTQFIALYNEFFSSK